MISAEDKAEHPVFYWALLLLLALCAFQLLAIVVGEVEGAWTANTYNATTDVSAVYGMDEFVHTKDDQYAIPYVPSADELWIAHKPTTGGSWGYSLIGDTYLYYASAGMRCSSNNTLIVWAHQWESTALQGYVWVKWPGDGWGDWTGYHVDGGTGFSVMSIAINNTDEIALGYRKSNWVYCAIFNLTSCTVTSSDSFGSGTNMNIDVESNQSGDFWILYGPNAGTIFLRDYNKTFGAISKAGYWYYPNMVCLPNDRFVVAAYYVFGSASRYVYYWYQHTHNGGFTSILISTAAGTTSWTYPKVGIAQGSLTPWVIAYNSTGDTVMSWHASWNAVQATWQSSEEYIATVTSYSLGTSSSVWPKVSGISFCQPKTGQAFHMMEDIATNLMQIWTQGISWTPDLTTAWPEITTASLDEGTYDVAYSFTMSKSGGTAPFEWTIVSGPAWLSIGLATGILTGTPTSVGTFVVQIQLADVIPRTDTESFNLKINSAVVEGEPPSGDGLLGTWGISAALMGELWILFIVTAMFVGVATAYRKYSDSVAGWKFAQRGYSQYRKPIYSGYKKRRRPPSRPKYRYRYD